MKITDFSVERPVTISMLLLILVVVGVIALSRLGIDFMPDIDFPTLTVMVRYPGASPEEVETMVAKPYEGALASVKGVKKVQSISQEDVCYLLMDFVWGTDLDAAAADVREAIALVEPYLPPDVEDPVVMKFSLTAMPELVFAVWGMDDTARMRKLLVDEMQDRLQRVDGVAQAAFFGGRTEEVQVLVDRPALEATGLDLDRVRLALMAQNLNLPAGRLVERRQERLLRSKGLFTSLDDIRDTVVGASPEGALLRVRNVATVRRGYQDLRNLVRAQGHEAVMLMMTKESGANPLKVREAFLEQWKRLWKRLPEGMGYGRLYDMGRVIRKMALMVLKNGLLGALLAVGVMYLFLRNLRPTLTIALAIPLSILTTFIPIYVTGDTLNMMTMGGLVLGIGLLVDNAVVVIESIYRHIEEGEDRVTAARRGAGEVAMAITASTLTTVVVFLPILFSTGLAGRLARGLALTVAFALFASLFVALTIVPMLASVFFSNHPDRDLLEGGSRFRAFQARYADFLRSCLRHRGRTLAVVGGLVLLATALFPFVRKEFMPATDQPIIMAKISFPVGTPLEETDAAASRIEQVLGRFPDVELVGTMVGVDEHDATQGLSETNPAGVHEAVLFVRLKDKKLRQVKRNEELEALFRDALPDVEGMKVEFTSMRASMGSSTHPVEVKLYGKELDVLADWAERIRQRLAEVPGLVDVDVSLKQAKPETHIVIDRDRAARYGLTVGQVAQAVQAATLGTVATRYREGGEEIDVRVRYAEAYRSDEQAIRHLRVPLPQGGGSVPLAQVAHLEPGHGPVRIVREDQERRVSITANLEGVDLGTAMRRVARTLAPVEDALPPGYDIDYAGQYADMVDAFQQLALALVLAVLMVYMVMAAQFESFAHPFTIMFTMPLALIGVVVAFFATRTTLSVPSFLGVIMLAGIVVNNGIVLVDYVNQLRRRGMERLEATVRGSSVRLRPVLITSLTTVMGMLPMALSQGEGSETMGPLALTIIGGLTAATGFTLVVVPVVYTLVDDAARRGRLLWTRLFHPEELEGAAGT